MEKKCFDGKQSEIYNVMTSDNCKNIEAALQYVTENKKGVSIQAVEQVQRYVSAQIKQWSLKTNNALTYQDIMYGLIRSNVVLQGAGELENAKPVSVRYAVEHPMRIPLMRYGVRSDDFQAVRRMVILTEMLFDKTGKPLYEAQGLFLGALLEKIFADTKNVNQATQDMIKVLTKNVVKTDTFMQNNARVIASHKMDSFPQVATLMRY